jgi:hypothetical protein
MPAAIPGLQKRSRRVRSNIRFQDGQYTLRNRNDLHSLDYFVLIDEDPKTGNRIDDLHRVLGVSTSWITGFIAGFTDELPAEDGVDYSEGFECGQAVVIDLLLTRFATLTRASSRSSKIGGLTIGRDAGGSPGQAHQ